MTMAPVIPNPKNIRSFTNEAAFEKWLAANHERETELWLKIHKKDSGLPTVTALQAIDVVLCWGWIDGIRKSIWSQINRDNVARLTKANRMTPAGQRAVDAAKADGRWDNAYASIRNASADTVPADLLQAINASAGRRSFWRNLVKSVRKGP